MGFGAAGLCLMNGGGNRDRMRTAASALLIFLSIWVNFAMVFVLLPLSIWRSIKNGGPVYGEVRVLLAVIFSFALTWWVMRPMGIMRPYSLIPPDGWPAAWANLARAMQDGLFTRGMTAGIIGIIIAGVLSSLVSTDARKSLKDAAALLSTGAAYFILIATIRWVADRAGDPRYALPVLTLLVSSAGISAADIFSRRSLTAFIPPLLLVYAVIIRAGLPHPAGIRAGLDRTIGTATPDIIRLGVTHLAGDYSRVWPAVFHANLALHRQSPGRTVWPLAYRGTPARPLWKQEDPRQWRIAVLRGDTGLTIFSPELKGAKKTAITPTITVYQRR